MRHPVYTSSQIRAIDAHTITELGIAGPALMEMAAWACARELMTAFGDEAARGVVIVAGKGNNGGDGYVIARMLHGAGVPVRAVGLPGEHSPECAAARRAAELLGVPVFEDVGAAYFAKAGVVVDALLGTGLSSELRGRALALTQLIKGAREKGAKVLAVDLPTGLCGDTGRVLGDSVIADVTVTFGRARAGQLLEPGADRGGRLVVADIGLIEVGSPAGPPVMEVLEGAEIAALIPSRAAASHKGRHGHLGVIAGSRDKAGAAVLCCNAAMRSGCGLVTLIVGPEVVPRLAGLRPEVMLHIANRATPELLLTFDALAVGPGRGIERPTLEQLRGIWRSFEGPAVFDADGLIALVDAFRPSKYPRCITPHPGEAARLLRLASAEVQTDRLGAVRALGAVAPALLKGRNTLICAGDGPVTVNATGTPDLATAGSGDVLTGIVGALLARGVAPRDALVVGAFVHGLAGERVGGYLVAGDLIDELRGAFGGLAERGGVIDYRPLLSR